MNPQEPVIPDPDTPRQNPVAPSDDPKRPDAPEEYDAYDEADSDSFPASDPPAASEPGV